MTEDAPTRPVETDDPDPGKSAAGGSSATEDAGPPAEGGRHGGDGSTAGRPGWRPTRRGVLRGTAAATVVAGFGGLTLGQEAEPLDPDEPIVLGGQVQGWEGREPEAIAGQTNPTLTLQAGETYEVTWVNVDGLPHNFVVLDPEEAVLLRTEIVDEQGAEQTTAVEVTEDVAAYRCEVHPTAMRGSIAVGPAELAQQGPQVAPVPEGPTVGLQRIAGDPLTQPVSFATATVGGEERRFVVDQTGEVFLLTEDGPTEFLDISDQLVIRDEGFDERGLLGLAFHPAFADNRRFYVRYSGFPKERELPAEFDHMFVLSEFMATETFDEADPESERVVLEIPEPQFNHNAGEIAFGPDNFLYVGVGDGGGADDTGVGHVNDWYRTNRGGNGQDVTENLLGSILRIDVDDREDDLAYGVPSDNPLVGTDGLDEHWAWGLRNPWRFSFNDGQLVVADVGQNLFEEIDVVERGGNYGWNVREASNCFSSENPGNPDAITECPSNAPDEPPYDGQPLVDPVLEYPHTVGGATVGLSVTGGYVYGGETLPDLAGAYVFGDWSASFGRPSGRLWIADLPGLDAGPPEDGEADAGNETATENETAAGNVTTANETTDGDVTAGGPAATGNETADGNATAGNETTGGNATAGNETAAGETATQFEFPMRELVVANSPDGRINRTVLAFGRDDAGELYVLTSGTTTVDGTGEVFRIVPPDQGDEITPPGEEG